MSRRSSRTPRFTGAKKAVDERRRTWPGPCWWRRLTVARPLATYNLASTSWQLNISIHLRRAHINLLHTQRVHHRASLEAPRHCRRIAGREREHDVPVPLVRRHATRTKSPLLPWLTSHLVSRSKSCSPDARARAERWPGRSPFTTPHWRRFSSSSSTCRAKGASRQGVGRELHRHGRGGHGAGLRGRGFPARHHGDHDEDRADRQARSRDMLALSNLAGTLASLGDAAAARGRLAAVEAMLQATRERLRRRRPRCAQPSTSNGRHRRSEKNIAVEAERARSLAALCEHFQQAAVEAQKAPAVVWLS